MRSDRPPARQSAAYRAIAVCGGIAAVVVVIVFVVAVATLPHPPPPHTTDERQVGYGMERAAGAYTHALFEATRSGPLTEARLAAVPLPDEGGVEVAGLSREGDTTVVTFSTHARYGRPDDLEETMSCYRVELVGKLDHPLSKKVADEVCSGTGETPGSQTNDSASGPSAGTSPSAAARVSRPRIAA